MAWKTWVYDLHSLNRQANHSSRLQVALEVVEACHRIATLQFDQQYGKHCYGIADCGRCDLTLRWCRGSSHLIATLVDNCAASLYRSVRVIEACSTQCDSSLLNDASQFPKLRPRTLQGSMR